MSSENHASDARNALVDAVRHLNEGDLRFLNHLIVERLKLIHQAKSTTLLSKFAAGDRVTFVTPDGDRKTGVIMKLNKKTASIRTDDGHDWKVHPSYLSTVIDATASDAVVVRELGDG